VAGATVDFGIEIAKEPAFVVISAEMDSFLTIPPRKNQKDAANTKSSVTNHNHFWGPQRIRLPQIKLQNLPKHNKKTERLRWRKRFCVKSKRVGVSGF
jgi:hypothetical protein